MNIAYNETQQRIADRLAGMTLIHGVSADEDRNCSMVAVNLALTGTLTDTCPDCVSPDLHRFVISIQDRMPEYLMNADDRHGRQWREALPLVAGTAGDGLAQWRGERLREWMWGLLSSRFGTPPEWVPMPMYHAWEAMLRHRDPVTIAAVRETLQILIGRADGRFRSALSALIGIVDLVDAALSDWHCIPDIASAISRIHRGTEGDWWRQVDPAGLLLELATGPKYEKEAE